MKRAADGWIARQGEDVEQWHNRERRFQRVVIVLKVTAFFLAGLAAWVVIGGAA